MRLTLQSVGRCAIRPRSAGYLERCEITAMLRLALSIILLSVFTGVVAQDGKKPRPLTEQETRLKALSPHILNQYWNTQGQVGKWCPTTGGTWEDVRIPPEATRDQFFRETRVICQTAYAVLPVFGTLASQPHVSPELFAFFAYLRDVSTLDEERYLRHLFGPFMAKSECEKRERSVQAAGIGTLSCGIWAYR